MTTGKTPRLRPGRWTVATIVATAVVLPAWASSLDAFVAQLCALPTTSPQSVPTAVAAYKALFAKDRASADGDRAFVAFRSFYYRVDLGDPTKLPPHVLHDNGLVMLMSEGLPYAGEDNHFFAGTFRPYVSQPIKAFLDLRESELREGFSEDAVLSIPFSALGERVATWEQYVDRYATSPVMAEAKNWLQLYVRTFVTGLDNTPVFDRVTRKLRPEMATAYDFYMKRHPTSRYTRLLREYLDVLDRHGDRDSAAGTAFLQRHGIGTMMGMQPPTR